MKKELGKYLLDVSKLVFGGVVLSGILRIEDVSKIIVLGSGIITTLLLAIGGFLLLKEKNN